MKKNRSGAVVALKVGTKNNCVNWMFATEFEYDFFLDKAVNKYTFLMN